MLLWFTNDIASGLVSIVVLLNAYVIFLLLNSNETMFSMNVYSTVFSNLVVAVIIGVTGIITFKKLKLQVPEGNDPTYKLKYSNRLQYSFGLIYYYCRAYIKACTYLIALYFVITIISIYIDELDNVVGSYESGEDHNVSGSGSGGGSRFMGHGSLIMNFIRKMKFIWTVEHSFSSLLGVKTHMFICFLGIFVTLAVSLFLVNLRTTEKDINRRHNQSIICLESGLTSVLILYIIICFIIPFTRMFSFVPTGSKE